MLDLGELLLVKTPMEVILRVTVVVKKMMVVMRHWVLLQQLPANTTTKNVPTIAKKKNASADNCLMQVSQAAPREYTYPRESSGARSGPPSPWGTGETKKRIVDALKNELSDIHLYTGDITTNSGCAKVNYAMIRQMYAPKHEMKKIRPNFKRLIESKKAMKGPFEMKAKVSKEIEP
jgi:hypothetical protein